MTKLIQAKTLLLMYMIIICKINNNNNNIISNINQYTFYR